MWLNVLNPSTEAPIGKLTDGTHDVLVYDRERVGPEGLAGAGGIDYFAVSPRTPATPTASATSLVTVRNACLELDAIAPNIWVETKPIAMGKNSCCDGTSITAQPTCNINPQVIISPPIAKGKTVDARLAISTNPAFIGATPCSKMLCLDVVP